MKVGSVQVEDRNEIQNENQVRQDFLFSDLDMPEFGVNHVDLKRLRP